MSSHPAPSALLSFQFEPPGLVVVAIAELSPTAAHSEVPAQLTP
jgi:hypothetical protein